MDNTQIQNLYLFNFFNQNKMKKIQLKTKSFLLIVMMLTLIAGKTFSQGTNDYNVCIRNIHQTSAKVIELDIWLEWKGTNKQKFQAFQGGLDFNYDGLANGGALRGEFVPGTADPSLPSVQQNPNWNINTISKQIRFLAAIAAPASVAVVTPPAPGFRLGTLRLTNTVDFIANVPMNFAWSFLNGSNTTTQSLEFFYLNGLSTGTGFSNAKDNSESRKMKVAEGGGCRLSANTTVEKLSALSAYPNPTSGKLKVKFNSEIKSKFNLKVSDMLGKAMIMDIIYTVVGENTKDLDMTNLAKGMYFLTMETEDSNVQTVIPIIIE